MENVVTVITATLIVAALFFIAPLLGAVFGAFGGWVVGLFFDDTIRSVLSRFGTDTANLHIWQLGAVLGFIGGFFRTSVSNNSD